MSMPDRTYTHGYTVFPDRLDYNVDYKRLERVRFINDLLDTYRQPYIHILIPFVNQNVDQSEFNDNTVFIRAWVNQDLVAQSGMVMSNGNQRDLAILVGFYLSHADFNDLVTVLQVEAELNNHDDVERHLAALQLDSVEPTHIRSHNTKRREAAPMCGC